MSNFYLPTCKRKETLPVIRLIPQTTMMEQFCLTTVLLETVRRLPYFDSSYFVIFYFPQFVI
jgi:hypothetical protein